MKLEKNQYPANSNANDFRCFGPVATKDTEFDGFKMADLGCFQQEEKGKTKDGDARVIDSNKMYHAAVVQHKTSSKWYLYVEFGRVGKSVTFQFSECTDENDAMRAFAAQCAEKNTKRGQWETVAGIKMFVPKKDSKGQLKDMYAVQQLASRNFGLPDARNISSVDPVQIKPKAVATKAKKSSCDPRTAKLMADLTGGTISYARTSIQGGTIPSQGALNDGRDLLQSAKQRLVKVGTDIKSQVKDRDLKQITYALYSKIPKIKPIGASEDTWILSQENITTWEQDIDAFESALVATDFESDNGSDPMQGMPLNMEWIDPRSELGEYICNWWRGATRNKHAGLGVLNILNLWKVERHGEIDRLKKRASVLAESLKKEFNNERPLHQDKKRADLSAEDRKLYWDSNTALLVHGSRTVNITGLLREGFRFPKELVGVTLTAANFGEGVYTADDYKKSVGYTSHKGSYWAGGSGGISTRKAFMFACDVVLGNPFIPSGSSNFRGPQNGGHSIFAKAGTTSYIQNNEFVIFDKTQIAQKYLVEFTF